MSWSMSKRKFKRLAKKSLDITFADIVNTPPEKKKAVDELMDRVARKSCEMQNNILKDYDNEN